MDDKYIKRLIKLVAEISAIALAVVLLQLLINWVGFGSAWPILVVILIALIIAIAAMRK